ncbi:MAG: hypothetical protein KDB14_22070 [Planctomycetales bacterium]|nr:hypothetical protein [Planctomycetales bacterium]
MTLVALSLITVGVVCAQRQSDREPQPFDAEQAAARRIESWRPSPNLQPAIQRRNPALHRLPAVSSERQGELSLIAPNVTYPQTSTVALATWQTDTSAGNQASRIPVTFAADGGVAQTSGAEPVDSSEFHAVPPGETPPPLYGYWGSSGANGTAPPPVTVAQQTQRSLGVHEAATEPVGVMPAVDGTTRTRRRSFGRPGAPAQQLVIGPATALRQSGDLPTAIPNVQARAVDGMNATVSDRIPSEVASVPPGTAPLSYNLKGLTLSLAQPQPIEDVVEEVPPGILYAPEYSGDGVVVDDANPIFGEMLHDVCGPCCNECSKLGKFLKMFRRDPCADGGVGRERLASAPMILDIAKPLPNTLRIRLDAAYDVQAPDRAEFYYSALRGGPDQIDYQDVRFQLELGGERISTATEVPIRVLDPSTGLNTAGLGDMNISVKTVLVDGETWQITQLFRTFLNTGAVTHQLSTGHVSMEPGLLFRMRWTDDTYWHGQIKYRFPVGGNPVHGGQVMQVGSALSKLWYETDQVALIPTLEANSYFVLDGQQFVGNTVAPVDGDMILNLAPSLRFVVENDSDLGLLEFGIGTSFAMTNTRWHRAMLALELRTTF